MAEPANHQPFSPLQRLALRAAQAAAAAQERCELCSEPIPSEHRHLLEVATRHIRCVCRACAILFDRGAASLGKHRLIPDRRLALEDFQLGDAQWERLRIPVGMAFFFDSSPARRVVAFYPSPMGPTESLLPLDTWRELEASNPVLASMQPDVEALLVNRARGARQCFLVPIDDCYRLVGVIRLHWKGLSGGAEVWREIGRFFAALQARAKAVRRDDRAHPRSGERRWEESDERDQQHQSG
jgi:hypothetical protein